MDHIKVMSALVNVLLSVFALLMAQNMGKHHRYPLFRSLSALALTHIAFELYFFIIYYADVNIWGPSRSPHNLVTISASPTLSYALGPLLTNVVALGFMLLMRVYWLQIAQGLIEEKRAHRSWSWFTFPAASLAGFLLIAVFLPDNGAFFRNGYTLFRIIWTVIGTIIMGFMLVKAKTIEDDLKRRALRWFAFLLLGSVAFFFLMFMTRASAGGQPALLRFLLESFYPIYTSLILPLWMWLFLRPWLLTVSMAMPESSPVSSTLELGLTEREQEILQLMLQGHSNLVIADKIFVSEHTVKNAITGLYAKLGVRNRKELLHRFQMDKSEG